MNWFSHLLGAVIAVLGVQETLAKNRVTDPLRIARDCKAGAELFCKGIRPGGQRVVVCLKQKIAELSPVCSTAIKSAE
jgi:hypothetical protein